MYQSGRGLPQGSLITQLPQTIYFSSLHLLAPGNRCSQVFLSCFQPDVRWIPVTLNSSQKHRSPGRHLAGGACIPYIQAHTWPRVYFFQSPFQLINTCSFFKTSRHTTSVGLCSISADTVISLFVFQYSSSCPFQNPHQTVLAWSVFKPASPHLDKGGGSWKQAFLLK